MLVAVETPPVRRLAAVALHVVAACFLLPGSTRGAAVPRVELSLSSVAQLERRADTSLGENEPRLPAEIRREDESKAFSLADHYIAERKLDEAEALLQEHLGRRPESAGALYRLGRVYFDRHDWTRSAGYLARALDIDPQNDRAHLILGLDYFQLGQLDAAEKELLTAVRQNPASDENQYMAGRFFFSKHKRSEALAFFYEAVRLNPENHKALHSLGLCFANLGNYLLAETYYKKAIEVMEEKKIEFDQVYLDLAELLTGTESARVPEGEGFARRAVELLPGSSDARFLLGRALYRQGKHAEALPHLIESVRLDAANSRPHFLLAKIYEKTGRKAEARAEWATFDRLEKLRTLAREQAAYRR